MTRAGLTRYAGGVVLGTMMAVLLIVVMERLIASPARQLEEISTRHFVDFVRVERQETFERKDRSADPPPPPDAPPPDLPELRSDAAEPTAETVTVPQVTMDLDLSIEGLSLAASDGDYLPIVRVAPVYPPSARRRGVEGYCVVEFTVTATGTVKDIVVVESEPKRIFDDASIEAASRFKYRPRVLDGEPIEVRGVRNLFRFKLES